MFNYIYEALITNMAESLTDQYSTTGKVVTEAEIQRQAEQAVRLWFPFLMAAVLVGTLYQYLFGKDAE